MTPLVQWILKHARIAKGGPEASNEVLDRTDSGAKINILQTHATGPTKGDLAMSPIASNLRTRYLYSVWGRMEVASSPMP